MKFSIVTPAHNSERFIAETIESVISQKGDFSIEFIIMDNCSTDRTPSIVDEYQRGKSTERIGNILIRRGYLDYESLKSAMKDQMKEVVYEVLRWKTGQFVYFNNVVPEHEDIFLDIKMDYLILEGLKRMDEADKGF